MTRPTSWKSLARTPASDLRRLQDAALARFAREELYPFSRHYRRIFDEAEDPPRATSAASPTCAACRSRRSTTSCARSRSAETRYDFVLRPSPTTIKEAWPFARKLALVLGGARAREALRFAYTPNFLTFTTGRSSEPVAFAYTPHDLDLLGEVGRAHVRRLGVDAAKRPRS